MMPQEVSSQATAGSSSVGSPWNVTVSVPPLTGVVLAAPPPPELLEPPQAARPRTRAASSDSASTPTMDLRTFMSPSPFLPSRQGQLGRRAALCGCPPPFPLLLPVLRRIDLVHRMQEEPAGVLGE